MSITKSDIIYNKLFTKDNIEKYIKKKYKNYEDNKIFINYFTLKDNANYCNIQSNKQISCLLKYSKDLKSFDIHVHHRLFIILFYYFPNNIMLKYLKNNNFINMNDNQIYSFLRNIYINNVKNCNGNRYCDSFLKNFYADETLNNKFMVFNIKKFIGKYISDFYNVKIIDIGCSNGKKISELSNLLGINKDNVYGADIPNWHNIPNPSKKYLKNFIEIKENKKYNLNNNMFDIVSICMTIHHIKDIDLTLKEINRITKINGFLLIKEHDVHDSFDRMLVDIEHAMWDLVYKKTENSTKSFYNDYYRYLNFIELHILLKNYGYKKIAFRFIRESIKQYNKANRAFIAIFKKVKDL